jgi:hypothetical protein
MTIFINDLSQVSISPAKSFPRIGNSSGQDQQPDSARQHRGGRRWKERSFADDGELAR